MVWQADDISSHLLVTRRAPSVDQWLEHPTAEHDQATTDQAWEHFVHYLKDRGDRVTTARRIVFGAVFARHDHFRADDLAGALASGANRVSRGTIYRTLALLVDAGLVRELHDDDTHAHYEHVFGHADHEHMVCRQCGRFVEFRDPVLSDRVERICRDHGFQRTSHRLVVFGTCDRCLRQDAP